MQRTQIFLMNPLLLAVFCREKGSSRVCLKGGMCTQPTRSVSHEQRVGGGTSLCCVGTEGECQYLNVVIAVGLYSVWHTEMGSVKSMWALYLHTQSAEHGCCSCKYRDLEGPSEGFSEITFQFNTVLPVNYSLHVKFCCRLACNPRTVLQITKITF